MQQKSPQEITEEILVMTDESCKLAEKLDNLEDLYCIWWRCNRDNFKSDKAAEKEWDLSKEGQEMRTIKTKIKNRERRISAYKTYLRVLEGEARNSY